MRSSYTVAELRDELGYKLVLTWWENIPYCNIFSDKTTFLKNNTLDKVDHFRPCSEMAKRAMLLEGIDPNRITVLYPGVDINKFKKDERAEVFAKSLGVPAD